MQIRFIFTLLLFFSCSTDVVKRTNDSRDFSEGEVILTNDLLVKIFDKQMAPIECVKDIEEAELLLRTLTPRFEIVQDNIEANLDDQNEIDSMIKRCQSECTCGHLDEIFKEHQVELTKGQKKDIFQKASEKELSRCLNFAQTTFCQSDLYKTLNEEKKEFNFEENP